MMSLSEDIIVLMCPHRCCIVMTYVRFSNGTIEAAMCGVQRDVVSAGHVVVGTFFVALPEAAAPNQLQRKNRCCLYR